MLERLDDVPWGDLEHAYGMADDVPALVRQLSSADPKVRGNTLDNLYSNIFHQGTRYPATPHVIPFLIELVAEPTIPDRGALLYLWGCLISGYFSVRDRPIWGDGEQLHNLDVAPGEKDDPYLMALHQIYRESVRGHALLGRILDDEDSSVRANAAYVLACLPTMAEQSIPLLTNCHEKSGWVRAAHAFALGELGAAGPLRRLLAEDDFLAVRCMAACELTRIEPSADLIEPLLGFTAGGSIEGYDHVPGAGGKSSGDVAFAISLLPRDAQIRAIPAICDQLDRARVFDTMPLVGTLLAAGFPERRGPITELNELQRSVLTRMVETAELWGVGSLFRVLEAHGLPRERQGCAALLGVRIADDEALAELRKALAFSHIGVLDEARAGIDKALAADPAVFERATAPDECWLLCARAFAVTDPDRARAAFGHALALNPAIRHRVNPSWRLAELLDEESL